jgi:hypothetical protein
MAQLQEKPVSMLPGDRRLQTPERGLIFEESQDKLMQTN